MGYLTPIYAVAGHALTARELTLFTKFLVIDKRLPQAPQGSRATAEQGYELIRKMSTVDEGSPNRLPSYPSEDTSVGNKCPRKGIFE